MGTTTLLNLWKRRRRQAGFFPPGTPKAIREALVCWYDPARQGATNESMAENPVLKDLSGNGHDMPCYNFAWTEESGINTTDYPGALVSDGVDDYGVAEGLPYLDDFTMMAKRQLLDEADEKQHTLVYLDNGNSAYRNYMDRLSLNGLYTSSFGTATMIEAYENPEEAPAAVWMTPTSYMGRGIRTGTPPAEADPRYGLNLFSAGYMKCALWSFLLFSRTLTGEEIEWVKANMVNGYPSPVAYYDCSKYSNGDMGDNPVLEDLSGNGNDLELHNFAFGGMSGFGGYNWNFNNFIRATYPHTDSTVRFDLSNPPDSYANEFTGYISPSSIPAVLKGVKIKVSGIASSSFNLYYQINLSPSGNVRKDIVVDKDGTYEFPDVDLSQYEVNNVYYGISHLDTPASDIIDVELIPEYPGGLVFDGVDDYGANGNFPSFNCKTLMMLFKHGNANEHKIYFDCRLDASTEYAVLFDTENIAFQARNKNGKTYINNNLNDSLRPRDLVDKKYLVAITNGSAEKGIMIKFGGNNTDASGYYANMVLYKALLFDRELTQKQMDKVIQDYGLMDDVDDVWNEQ